MSNGGWWLRVFFVFLALTLLLVAPILPTFSQALPGGTVAHRDAWQNVWNLWWVQQALSQARNPFISPMLYYPEGVDLSIQTLNVTNGILVAPATTFWGPIAGYNLAVILAFVLSGLAAYALACEITPRRSVALIAALLFTYSPFHLTKFWDGQLELIAMQWLPLYALFLLRSARYRQWRDGLLAGFFLAMIGYTSWYYFLFMVVYSVVFTILWLKPDTQELVYSSRDDAKQIRPPKHRSGVLDADLSSPSFSKAAQAQGRKGISFLKGLSVLGLAALSGAALMLPIVLPALRILGVGAPAMMVAEANARYQRIIHSADLVDPWLPSAIHPVWGQAVTGIGTRIHPYIAAWNIALGYVALLLALLSLRRWQQAWRWWLLFMVGIMLALGPELHIHGKNTGIRLPYDWLVNIPGINIAQRPSHFIVIAIVALIPLSALGLDALLSSIRARWHGPALIAIAVLAAIELLPAPLSIVRSDIHPYYKGLAGQQGAVIDLPPRLEDSATLEAQLAHGLPMMGGFVSRTPRYVFAQSAPVVNDLWALEPNDNTLIPSGKDQAVAILNTFGFRHVIVHWDKIPVAQHEGLKQLLAQSLGGVRPVFEDQNLSAYRIPEQEPQPLAFYRRGWYKQEQDASRTWRWMTERGEISLINPYDQPIAMQLTLHAQSFGEERLVQLSLNNHSLTKWHVSRAGTALSLHVLVPPGTSQLILETDASLEKEYYGRRLSIVMIGQSVSFGMP